ncbi:MAG: hypothetical protein ACRCZ9_06805 [Fusobacteriaceae bacterium]
MIRLTDRNGEKIVTEILSIRLLSREKVLIEKLARNMQMSKPNFIRTCINEWCEAHGEDHYEISKN